MQTSPYRGQRLHRYSALIFYSTLRLQRHEKWFGRGQLPARCDRVLDVLDVFPQVGLQETRSFMGCVQADIK